MFPPPARNHGSAGGAAPAGRGSPGIAGGAEGINAILVMNHDSGYTTIVMAKDDPPAAEKIGGQIRARLTNVKNQANT